MQTMVTTMLDRGSNADTKKMMKADETRIHDNDDENYNEENKAEPLMELEGNILPYHPKSDLRRKPGFYPNLSSAQIKAARDCLSILRSEGLSFANVTPDDDEHEFLKVLRFLRARKFNVDETMEMIRKDVSWRSSPSRRNFRTASAEEVLGCDPLLLYEYFPTWVQGVDKQGRPVSWRKFGRCEIWNMLKLTSVERLVDFHVWESEQLLRIMSTQKKHNIETFAVVLDASGWNLGQANRDSYALIKAIVDIDSNHYPERLGQLLVVNAPAQLSLAWRVIQGALDGTQKAKIRIYGTNPEEWRPVLFAMVSPEHVPREFGGSMPDLRPDQMLASLEPPRLPLRPNHIRPPQTIATTSMRKGRGGGSGEGCDDDQTVMPSSTAFCGTQGPKRAKKKGGKMGNGGLAKEEEEEDTVLLAKKDVATQPSSSGSSSSGAGGDSSSSSSSSKSRSRAGWFGLLNCAPPTCNGGEEDFDYTISVRSGGETTAPELAPGAGSGGAGEDKVKDRGKEKGKRKSRRKKNATAGDAGRGEVIEGADDDASNFSGSWAPSMDWDAESRVTAATAGAEGGGVGHRPLVSLELAQRRQITPPPEQRTSPYPPPPFPPQSLASPPKQSQQPPPPQDQAKAALWPTGGAVAPVAKRGGCCVAM